VSAAGLDLPRRPRVLVITLRRLGDVLLSTPLIRTLKHGIPDSTVDALVFRGTEGMLAGNPDVDNVVTIPQRPTLAETVTALYRLWRRYDLAVTTQTGDRPTTFAFVAGRRRLGFVSDAGPGRWWKQRLLDRFVVAERGQHRVTELLRLADCIGAARRSEIVCPRGSSRAPALPNGRYAVLHANPMFGIRRWTDAGWRELARALAERGLVVVVTGGPDPVDKDYLERVWQGANPPVTRLDGKLDWPGLVSLLQGAAVYVGPDTSMSHLAAATGAPTVAIYGPESPRIIGPWPVGGLDKPWAPAGTIQQRGNVWVVQNPLPCLPCNKLGCENHLASYSRCLDELSARQVITAVDQALASRAALAS